MELCDYHKAINEKLEPEVRPLVEEGRTEEAVDCSKAISLKRIANALDRLAEALPPADLTTKLWSDLRAELDRKEPRR